MPEAFIKVVNGLLAQQVRVANLPEETREPGRAVLEMMVKSFTKDVEAHTRKVGRVSLLSRIFFLSRKQADS